MSNGSLVRAFVVPNRAKDWVKAVSSRDFRFKESSEVATTNLFALQVKKETQEFKVEILEKVGSGSYGTVHKCRCNNQTFVAKRCWTHHELLQQQHLHKSNNNNDNQIQQTTTKEYKQRANRCRHYLLVEAHCLAKVQPLLHTTATTMPVPAFKGVFADTNGTDWLVMTLVTRHPLATDPALSLADVMNLDWSHQHTHHKTPHHHLSMLQQEMGLPPDTTTIAATLDVVFMQLLRLMNGIHQCNVVHRDVKPQNILVNGHYQSFVLIDFGSAADLDPTKSSLFGIGGRVGLEDDGIVAVSPIYAAPESFVKWDRAPLNFDTFSTALIFCQLLFNLLDERTDAAFRQQLTNAKYDLDTWLDMELSENLRPVGLEDTLTYLSERPGLWQLLKDMLVPDPEKRATTRLAMERFEKILSIVNEGRFVPAEEADGPYFASVLDSLESCEVPEATSTDFVPNTNTAVDEMVNPRPLHFVATFNRGEPLGLVLAEADSAEEDDDIDDFEEIERRRVAWKKGTSNARLGEVFVRNIVKYGQADDIGIFEVGDRLRGIGEFPITNGGFEKVVDMLGRQPKNSQTIKLHFDRRSSATLHSTQETAPHFATVLSQGAWTTKGRRKAQEDRFVLHEIQNGQENVILMAGIFDGHGGKAAAQTVSQILPSLFASELAFSASNKCGDNADPRNFLKNALLSSWNFTCNTYRSGCDEHGECIADYDPKEGIILANTGSKDLVAGTTATVAVLSVAPEGIDQITILNCGDSRLLLIGKPCSNEHENKNQIHASVIYFATRDHSPSDDMEVARLQAGKEAGLDYSLPQCSISRWRLTVGDYQYSLCRSLEGSFVTSKGIVSDPDVTILSLATMLTERQSGTLLLASDGLFEVLDNEQVGREVLKLREMGLTSEETAKQLCLLALNKGTSDNVSVIVVYFS